MLNELRVTTATASCAGRRRRTNADAYLVDEAAGLLAVGDGMGDTPRSAAVAKMAMEAVREMFLDPWLSRPPAERTIGEAVERLCLGVVQANGRLFVPAARRTAPRSGTTLVAVVLCAWQLCVVSVGDSRAYLLRNSSGRLERLTRDDTVLQESLLLGVPYAVAIAERDAHALTRAIGVRAAVEAVPIIHRSGTGDTLLLCTDGLTDRVHDEEIADVLAYEEDLERAAYRLIERAREAGGWDDATVVLARRGSGAGAEGEDVASVHESGVRRIDECQSRGGVPS